MANTTTTAPKSYKEVNPFDAVVASAEKLLTASKLRQALYHYMREITDEYGIHDVPPASALDIASHYHRHVGVRSGFDPEQCTHINAQLDTIYELTTQAYPHFRAT